jgi:hypothetical protein
MFPRDPNLLPDSEPANILDKRGISGLPRVLLVDPDPEKTLLPIAFPVRTLVAFIIIDLEICNITRVVALVRALRRLETTSNVFDPRELRNCTMR